MRDCGAAAPSTFPASSAASPAARGLLSIEVGGGSRVMPVNAVIDGETVLTADRFGNDAQAPTSSRIWW
jgi:hypothetical protein